jgi:hypothetical protein
MVLPVLGPPTRPGSDPSALNGLQTALIMFCLCSTCSHMWNIVSKRLGAFVGDDIEASETSVVAFRCDRKLKAAIEERAQDEGLSLGGRPACRASRLAAARGGGVATGLCVEDNVLGKPTFRRYRERRETSGAAPYAPSNEIRVLEAA